MKLSPLMLLALALCAGLTPAAAQERQPAFDPPLPRVQRTFDAPPAPRSRETDPEPTLLGANYRIVIAATLNGNKAGELAALTCSSPFEMNGFLVMPTVDDAIGASLTVRGGLAEVEGGTLKLSYDMRVDTPVPTQTFGLADGTHPMSSTYHYIKTGAKGMLQLKPGQSYEVMKISGVVYAITITPTETPPAAKAQPGDKPPTATPRQPAEASRTEIRKPSAAGREEENTESRKRFDGISAGAKEKFRDAMKELFSQERFRNAPEEERRAEMKKTFDKIEAEDQAQNK